MPTILEKALSSRNTVTLPRSTMSALYRQMQNMKKSYEQLDHMMAQIEELQGKTVKTDNKSLAHDLGY